MSTYQSVICQMGLPGLLTLILSLGGCTIVSVTLGDGAMVHLSLTGKLVKSSQTSSDQKGDGSEANTGSGQLGCLDVTRQNKTGCGSDD